MSFLGDVVLSSRSYSLGMGSQILWTEWTQGTRDSSEPPDTLYMAAGGKRGDPVVYTWYTHVFAPPFLGSLAHLSALSSDRLLLTFFSWEKPDAPSDSRSLDSGEPHLSPTSVEWPQIRGFLHTATKTVSWVQGENHRGCGRASEPGRNAEEAEEGSLTLGGVVRGAGVSPWSMIPPQDKGGLVGHL